MLFCPHAIPRSNHSRPTLEKSQLIRLSGELHKRQDDLLPRAAFFTGWIEVSEIEQRMVELREKR